MAVVGFLGFAAGLWIGLRRRDLAVERAIVGAVAVNVLIRSELGGFLGLSAIIGIGLSVGTVRARRPPPPESRSTTGLDRRCGDRLE